MTEKKQEKPGMIMSAVDYIALMFPGNQFRGEIIPEVKRLEQVEVDHSKAATLQERLRTYHDEWLVFLDHPEVPPTNNLAEQALRPLVVLRKLTFGSRSRAGAERLANLLTVVDTAKRHGHDVLSFLYKLQTRSPGRMLRFLYETR